MDRRSDQPDEGLFAAWCLIEKRYFVRRSRLGGIRNPPPDIERLTNANWIREFVKHGRFLMDGLPGHFRIRPDWSRYFCGHPEYIEMNLVFEILAAPVDRIAVPPRSLNSE